MDELGRVVIPKEIRKTYRIKEGDPIEIFINENGELTIKKHSPVKDVSVVASAYAEALSSTTGYSVLITDNDGIISAAGTGKKEYIGKPVSAELYKTALNRKTVVLNRGKGDSIIAVKKEEDAAVSAQVIAPILEGGDIFGAVVLQSYEKNASFDQHEQALCAVAAAFIASQLA